MSMVKLFFVVKESVNCPSSRINWIIQRVLRTGPPAATGMKPEKKPLGVGTHGVENGAWTTEWFYAEDLLAYDFNRKEDLLDFHSISFEIRKNLLHSKSQTRPCRQQQQRCYWVHKPGLY